MQRPFKEEDLDPCADLFLATFAAPPWNETWDRRVILARLRQIVLTPGFHGVVHEENGGIVGFALGFSEPWHDGSHFYLKEMCIHPACQRRGKGRALLEFLISRLAEGDASRIYLLTARGDLSEVFYQKAGFHVSPKMILMARRLEPG